MDTKKIYVIDAKCESKYVTKDKTELPLIPVKKMVEHYPNGGYQVLGDFKPATKQATDLEMVYRDQVFRLQTHSGNVLKNEYVLGYVPVEGTDCFVRVLKKKKGTVLLGLILVALLLTIFSGGLWLGKKDSAVDTPVKIKAGSITNPNPENIRLPGIEKVYAKSGKTLVNQPLLNVTGNAVNLTYSIILTQTGEQIYESPKIQPGYGVKQFEMTRTFKAGSYPISILVKATDLNKKGKKDKKVAYNAGQLNATLVVK